MKQRRHIVDDGKGFGATFINLSFSSTHGSAMIIDFVAWSPGPQHIIPPRAALPRNWEFVRCT